MTKVNRQLDGLLAGGRGTLNPESPFYKAQVEILNKIQAEKNAAYIDQKTYEKITPFYKTPAGMYSIGGILLTFSVGIAVVTIRKKKNVSKRRK